jgi:hypothetical protein
VCRGLRADGPGLKAAGFVARFGGLKASAPSIGRYWVVLSHPFAEGAKGWGTGILTLATISASTGREGGAPGAGLGSGLGDPGEGAHGEDETVGFGEGKEAVGAIEASGALVKGVDNDHG